jgi:hypothetical protein
MWNLMHVWYDCCATLPPYLTAAFISIYKYTTRVNPLHHMHEQIRNISQSPSLAKFCTLISTTILDILQPKLKLRSQADHLREQD